MAVGDERHPHEPTDPAEIGGEWQVGVSNRHLHRSGLPEAADAGFHRLVQPLLRLPDHQGAALAGPDGHTVVIADHGDG